MTRTSILTVLIALAGWTAGTVSTAAAATPAQHPSLVDVASTNCTDCHDDLWEESAAIHPPAEDDCTTCHELSKSDDGMQVALTEEGPPLCLLCHDELTAAAEADYETPHFPVTDSCTSCHSPHASTRQRLLKAPVKELCAECHDMADLDESHGGQLAADVRCQSCHEPHGGQNPSMLVAKRLHAPFKEGSCNGCHRPPMAGRVRLRKRGEKLCLSCHGNLLTEGHTAHPAIFARRDQKGCLSCHDPHMSPNARLLVAPGPEVCKSCHGEAVAQASAEGGHPPAADDCTICHLPHDAEHPKLLSEAPDEVCALCHDTDDEGLRSAHLGADLAALSCTGCHSPHGSEHGRLLAKHLHPPVLDGCDICHDETYNAFLDEQTALCEMCHDDVTAAAAAAAVPHAALELGSCTDCHNPHASPQERLVKAPGAGPCVDCHDDMEAGEDEFAHSVIGRLGCRACHEPHGGSQEKLLRVTGNELCLSCHDKSRLKIEEGQSVVTLLDRFEVSTQEAVAAASLSLQGNGEQGHPSPFHRALGVPTEEELKLTQTSFRGELTCLTCHDPHKGRSPRLFVDGLKGRELCARCHREK